MKTKRKRASGAGRPPTHSQDEVSDFMITNFPVELRIKIRAAAFLSGQTIRTFAITALSNAVENNSK